MTGVAHRALRAGPTNGLLDVAGLSVGQHTHRGQGWLSGVTVILAAAEGMTAGVDVRGGGPGTRETDLLDPGAHVQKVNAITFTGGSAYGLAAASGVADELGRRQIGYSVGADTAQVVPIVPSAVIFDLGRGGDFSLRPGHGCGVAAVTAALTDRSPLELGTVGAGTGARAGGFKGGVGSASTQLNSGGVVAALVVLNALGSVLDGRNGELLGARNLIAGDPSVTRPSTAEWRHYLAGQGSGDIAPQRSLPTGPTQNTTLAVVATDIPLSKAQCRRLAGSGHNGLARAVNPVHTMFDGDTMFGVSTGCFSPARAVTDAGLAGAAVLTDDDVQFELMVQAAECVTRAVVRALLAAESVTTASARFLSYPDTFPSAVL